MKKKINTNNNWQRERMRHHPALCCKPTDVLLRTLGPSTSISLFTCDEASSQVQKQRQSISHKN